MCPHFSRGLSSKGTRYGKVFGAPRLPFVCGDVFSSGLGGEVCADVVCVRMWYGRREGVLWMSLSVQSSGSRWVRFNYLVE